MDWKDLTIPGRMRAWMVEPNRLGNVLGELTGVQWDACSIECGYYIDTRTTAKLVVHDGNWDGRAWIRLTWETTDATIVIGTYVVTDEPCDSEYGRDCYELSLNSVLFALSQEFDDNPWTISKGAYTSACLKRLFNKIGHAYSDANLKEYRAEKSYVLERGKSVLDWLFDIADHTGNRVDVNGYGVVTFSRRIAPQSIPQKFILDIKDERGLIKGGLHRDTDRLNTPGRVVIHHQVGSGDNAKDIVAHADAKGSASYSYRGYLKVDFQSVSDMSPETYAQALKLAQQSIKEQGVQQIEWSFPIVALPIWEGTGVTLLPHNTWYTGARKCFVKSIEMSDLNLNRPTMNLTLKECASGDKGDE